MRAVVKEKREVAERTLFLVFDLQGREVDFEPGQYFWVTLPDPPYDDERGNRRHITVATSPTERGVLGLATRLRDSAFKRSLAELEVGDPVEVEEPKGSFVLPEDTGRRYVFVAGGIGITVFRSMLRYIADKSLPYDVTLLYSNRDVAGTAFLDELRELERQNGLRLVLTMTQDPEWEGEGRHMNEAFFEEYLGGDLNEYTYLVAGPPPMVSGIVKTLHGLGVAEENVIPEQFSGYD